MNDDRFAPFERKWLDSSPDQAMATIFLPARVRRSARAFGVLIHELTQAAFRIRDPRVAATKLDWWRCELVDAGTGHAHHPITQILFDDMHPREGEAALWPRLAQTALGQIESPPAPDLSGLLEQMRPWHVAVASAQSAVLGCNGKHLLRDADLLTLSHLLHTFADAGTPPERLALPLNLLAGHGLTRETARSRDPNAVAFAQTYLGAIADALNATMQRGTIDILPIRVRMKLDEALIAAARRVPNPLDYLPRHGSPGRWRCLHVCWREARVLARHSSQGS